MSDGTPREAFKIPILRILVDMGGRAEVGYVLTQIERQMGHTFTEQDCELVGSRPPEPRWRNQAKWARKDMIGQGWLSSISPHGIWEITDAGRRYIAAHRG